MEKRKDSKQTSSDDFNDITHNGIMYKAVSLRSVVPRVIENIQKFRTNTNILRNCSHCMFHVKDFKIQGKDEEMYCFLCGRFDHIRGYIFKTCNYDFCIVDILLTTKMGQELLIKHGLSLDELKSFCGQSNHFVVHKDLDQNAQSNKVSRAATPDSASVVPSGASSVIGSGGSSSTVSDMESIKMAIRQVLAEEETLSQISDVTSVSISDTRRANRVIQPSASAADREAEIRAKMAKMTQEYNQYRADLAAVQKERLPDNN